MALMKSSSKIVLMVIAFLLSGCTKSVANSTEQKRATSTLFDQFETVFYAKSDVLSASLGYKGLSKQDTNTVRAPFAYLLGGFDPLGKQVSAEILGNADAALVGVKDFRPPQGPTGLGDVQSRFCYIIVLRDRNTFDLSKVADKAGVMSPAEASTWKWSVKGGEGHPGPYTYYAMQVAHSYLLISKDRDDLQAVSAKLSASDTPLSLSGIRDWEGLSQHEVWGYRRYRHTEMNKDAAGTLQVSPDTEALAFFVNLKQKTAVLRLFSPTASTAQKMNETSLLSPFKVSDSGVWQTVIPLTGNQKSSDQLFVVMSWFGFGVSV
jgi:hypothetical protein